MLLAQVNVSGQEVTAELSRVEDPEPEKEIEGHWVDLHVLWTAAAVSCSWQEFEIIWHEPASKVVARGAWDGWREELSGGWAAGISAALSMA